jgi:hypothetical protein
MLRVEVSNFGVFVKKVIKRSLLFYLVVCVRRKGAYGAAQHMLGHLRNARSQSQDRNTATNIWASETTLICRKCVSKYISQL